MKINTCKLILQLEELEYIWLLCHYLSPNILKAISLKNTLPLLLQPLEFHHLQLKPEVAIFT